MLIIHTKSYPSREGERREKKKTKEKKRILQLRSNLREKSI